MNDFLFLSAALSGVYIEHLFRNITFNKSLYIVSIKYKYFSLLLDFNYSFNLNALHKLNKKEESREEECSS